MPTRRSKTCVQDRMYEGRAAGPAGWNDRPVTGTPTLFLDGELVDTSELITGESFDPEPARR